MKKYLFTLFLALIWFGAKAQMYFNDGSFNIGSSRIWPDEARKRRLDEHLAGTKVYKFYADSAKVKRKHNGYLSQEVHYDKYGNVAEFINRNKHGKMTSYNSYVFNDKNQYIQYTQLDRKERLSFHMANSFDKNGDCTDIWFFYRSSSPSHKVQRFDSSHRMVEMIYKYKNDKVSSRFEFSYYDDGSKKQTKEYDRKGKIVHTWNFDCNPVGKLEAKKFKDTTKICVRYEKDKDGNPIKIKEEFIKQGNLVREVEKYDSRDNLLDEAYYDKQGRISSHITYTYNSNGRMVSYISYRKHSDKIASKYEYTYGTDNEVSEAMIFDRHDKPKYVLKYAYLKNS